METLKRWFDLLVTSSSDPLKFSLTVRGAATLAGAWVLKVAVIACTFGYCVGITDDTIHQAIEIVTNFGYGAALIVGSVMAVVGLLRKIKNGQWTAA